MLYIKKISLFNFKNYDELNLSFDKDVNCIVGKNGSGKTNLLDAIYYLAFTKSAFNHLDNQLIKKGETSFFVNGTFKYKKREDFISTGLTRGKKKEFLCNKKPYEKLNEHIGKIPLVLVTPYDTDLIREGSETRRKFFDGIISQLDSTYLNHLIQYNQLLKQRNYLLKSYLETRRLDEDLLTVLTEQMIPFAEYIFTARNNFLKDYIPIFKDKYKLLTNESELVSIQSKLSIKSESISDEFKVSLVKDKQNGRSNFGPHRQDYAFLMNEMNVNKFGSQGQQKSFIIALKLAQFQIIESRKKIRPILMLDDMFDRIDQNRINQFIEMISAKEFGQLFITDTHKERIEKAFFKVPFKLHQF